MDVLSFRRRYEGEWRALENLLRGGARRRAGALRGDRIRELTRLYQEAASHLSYARAYFPDHDVTVYLNALTARAHLAVYGKRGGQWRSVGSFLAADFPAAVRSCGAFFALAWLIMLSGAAVGFIAVLLSRNSLYAFLPASFVHLFHPSATGPHVVNAPLMASSIMSHNIEVTVLSFLGAFTLGLFTVYELYFNGLLLGAIAALFLRDHRSLMFWSLILPHGCIELTAISIAGAAGLSVAYRLLVPGRLTRRESFRTAALTGARLLAGTMVMLVIAGTIEGFLTPSSLSIGFKYAFAAGTAVLLVVYFSLAGRRGLSRRSHLPG
ncbi:MAG: stage II sporulation protein M [Bacilli bacterium]